MIEEGQNPSPELSAKIKLICAEQRAHKAVVMSPADAGAALGLGPTRIGELINSGELSTILDGKLRRVFTASVFDYLVRRAIETHPVDTSSGPKGRPSPLIRNLKPGAGAKKAKGAAA
jgi:hypothetical protein